MPKDLPGRERKETRQQRDARIQANREAHEKCNEMIPYIVGGSVGMVVLFILWTFIAG